MCLQRTNNEEGEDVRQIISLFNSVLCYFKNLRGTIKAVFIVKKQYLLAAPRPSPVPCCQPAGKALLGKGNHTAQLLQCSWMEAAQRELPAEQSHGKSTATFPCLLATWHWALLLCPDKGLGRSEGQPALGRRNAGVQLL